MVNTQDINTETLAHAVELATKISAKVSGDDVANSLNGRLQDHQDIRNTVVAQMQSEIDRQVGK